MVTGEQLVKMRVERGLTQADVADLIGASSSVIHRLENDLHDDEGLKARLLSALREQPRTDDEHKKRVLRNRLLARQNHSEPGLHGWCQLCTDNEPATRLVNVRGNLYALCDEHEMEDIEVWVTTKKSR